MKPVSYNYPHGGQYNETVAVFADGRKATINTQYAAVLPHGDHADGCEQLIKMGGRCTCAHNADIMEAAAEIVADARANGKRGYAPKPAKAPEPEPVNSRLQGLSRAEIEQKAKEWDELHNEGGEGYNPYRD